ncbi:unnamed protein product [Ceutorhynchus assimilis]|uniref:Uncharacterized protein n=1 Tax=Ceutorhynchus assimilis TaxID=467358 RepID=A0A9N9QQL9_9CUCU|nr:unnamed protein product [Ceutorhynchus assimilis]
MLKEFGDGWKIRDLYAAITCFMHRVNMGDSDEGTPSGISSNEELIVKFGPGEIANSSDNIIIITPVVSSDDNNVNKIVEKQSKDGEQKAAELEAFKKSNKIKRELSKLMSASDDGKNKLESDEKPVIEEISNEELTGSKHSKINNSLKEKEESKEKVITRRKEKITKSREKVTEKNVEKPSESEPCCQKPPREKLYKYHSDIFSLENLPTNLQTAIFSVNGAQSRKVYKIQESADQNFRKEQILQQSSAPLSPRLTRDNYNDEKRPSNSYRNPLTGSGLQSSDEYAVDKRPASSYRNPLTGSGLHSRDEHTEKRPSSSYRNPLTGSGLRSHDEYTEKRPPSGFRNPLTGNGLHSHDEYKGKTDRRIDGNPVLGLGYDPEVHQGGSNRVPPGGYAHKLW